MLNAQEARLACGVNEDAAFDAFVKRDRTRPFERTPAETPDLRNLGSELERETALMQPESDGYPAGHA